MKPLTVEDQENIRRFIKKLKLRHPKSPIIYGCFLTDFQRFAIQHSAGKPLAAETVRTWLEERVHRWPLHIVFHRARLVDRFLDWMTACDRLPSNPLHELRSEYGQRTTTPIIRALLSPPPAAALECLRPLPPFGSFLGPRMEEHVALMRSLGHRYDAYSDRLLRFDRFLQRRPDLIDKALPVLIEAWRQAGTGLQHGNYIDSPPALTSRGVNRLSFPINLH